MGEPADSMAYWLGLVAGHLRHRAGRKMVRVAAAADVTESTISRFEKGRSKGFPHDPDRIVAAYATELDIQPYELWAVALELWREAATGAAQPADVQALIAAALARAAPPPGGTRAGNPGRRPRGRRP